MRIRFSGSAVIVSETDETLKLQVGRNCPYKLIWNGETLLCKNDFCNITPENEHADVQMQKGENELIVKICRMTSKKIGISLHKKGSRHAAVP